MKTFTVLAVLAVSALAAPQVEACADAAPIKPVNAAAATNGTKPGPVRIVSSKDFDKGIAAVYQGENMYHRYSLLHQLLRTRYDVSDADDKEVNDFLARIADTNEARGDKARKSLADAKAAFAKAVAPENAQAVAAGVEEAKGRLNEAWKEANALWEGNSLTNLVQQWFSSHA